MRFNKDNIMRMNNKKKIEVEETPHSYSRNQDGGVGFLVIFCEEVILSSQSSTQSITV